ncbi:MAG: FAD-binding protein [Eubacterium sp.]|nr:FAD-binding protein [Eubacterium sp.]
MIRIQQLKLPLAHDHFMIENKIRNILGLRADQEFTYEIAKRSVDARKKPQVYYVYTVDVSMHGESKLVKKLHKPNIQMYQPVRYHFPKFGDEVLKEVPVIIGSGPAGLFCAYELALHGYRPIVVERGKQVEERTADVRHFWETNMLNPASNVQFGEGGAGTFSDGKLNTMVKDPTGRGKHVLEVFCKFGAPSEILYDQKPHIGTDILVNVIKNMREEIKRLGGKFYFEHQMTNLDVSDGVLKGVTVRSASGEKCISAQVAVLALGHSARDTFEYLHQNGFQMESKAFAVGFRVEHPQRMINESQYGKQNEEHLLPVAPYKVTANFPNQRGVYSFCMCPGGYVVNASSEEGYLAVNGMSYYKRDSKNANSAIIISVTPADFPGDSPLSGVQFQRELERKAYALCDGKIPQQLYGDFLRARCSTQYGDFDSCVKGLASFGALHELLTPDMNRCFEAGMEQFGKRLQGFDRADAILSGIESRTSSPIRITRDANYESNKKGVYPCGEGAGYAGGITSAAMDGIKVAEAIAKKYRPFA